MTAPARIGALALMVLVLPAWQEVAEIREVTYLFGGLMSGPYRVSADLRAGVVSEAKPPEGKRGDGAGLNAGTMPATRTRPLPPTDAAHLQALAASVWRNGAVIPRCLPSVDALVRFHMVQAGASRDFDVSTICMNADAKALQRALLCAVAVEATGCPPG